VAYFSFISHEDHSFHTAIICVSLDSGNWFPDVSRNSFQFYSN